MTKNIVFFADGTWNGPGKDFEGNTVTTDPSNVLKLYHWLSGKETLESMQLSRESEKIYIDESDGRLIQVEKYINGVGYDANWLFKVLGGVLGSGVITRIVRGYTYISRNYEPDDKIYIIGFSRGAYTARALAGLILSQGLLDKTKTNLNDKENAYRLGCAIWYKQRQIAVKNNNDLVTKLQDTVVNLPFFFSPQQNIATINDIKIELIGVWDTVGSLGIPQFNNTKDKRIDVFNFADTVLNDRVKFGFHAISLDEQRVDFTPTLWQSRADITQRLFPGAHADVGGGYPIPTESGLSDGALMWMQEKTRSCGLQFDGKPNFINPDPLAIAHQPWIYYPYNISSMNKAHRSFDNSVELQIDDSLNKRRKGGKVFPDPSATDAEPYNPPNYDFS